MSIPELTVEQAEERLAEDHDVVYLDVRTESEFAEGHVPGAINIPVAVDEASSGRRVFNPAFLRVVEANVDKDRAVICGCRSGGRSAQAVTLLMQAGFTNVHNLIGGFHGSPSSPGWAAQGKPVCRDPRPENTYTSLSARAQ